jgi:hypothetical protein
LKPHLHPRDRIVIFKVRTVTPWAGSVFSDEVARWLREHLETPES